MSDSKKLKAVYVEWYDHHSKEVWVHADEIKIKKALITTVAMLVKEDEDSIVVTTGQCEADGDVCGYMAILKSCIKKRRSIKLP